MLWSEFRSDHPGWNQAEEWEPCHSQITKGGENLLTPLLDPSLNGEGGLALAAEPPPNPEPKL